MTDEGALVVFGTARAVTPSSRVGTGGGVSRGVVGERGFLGSARPRDGGGVGRAAQSCGRVRRGAGRVTERSAGPTGMNGPKQAPATLRWSPVVRRGPTCIGGQSVLLVLVAASRFATCTQTGPAERRVDLTSRSCSVSDVPWSPAPLSAPPAIRPPRAPQGQPRPHSAVTSAPLTAASHTAGVREGLHP